MAITIDQQPTYPNATYTHLMYAVSSPSSSNDQYKYVVDVRQGANTLTRIKQYPNPANAGIFDLSRIMNDYIVYDKHWTISNLTPANTSVQSFVVAFGEEWASSPSSSVVLYDGQGNPGQPNVTGTTPQVIAAVVDPNNASSYNWSAQAKLSNRPSNVPMAASDYSTISVYDDGTLPNVTVTYKDNTGSTIGTESYNTSTNFSTIPIGSVNVSNYSNWYTIEVNIDGEITIYTLDDNCFYDRVNFAFINNYGFWDYYGVTLPKTKQTELQRSEITKSFVDYSSATSTYDITRRGKKYYNIKYNDRYTIVTNWLSQEEADWLSELLESPEVFVQQGSTFVPIVLTNSQYVHNTNKRSQKVFQYTIEYQYANNRVSR